MTVNWTFTLGSSFSTHSISTAVQQDILNIFQAAGQIWSRYLGDSSVTISVLVQVLDFDEDTTLAQAGPETSVSTLQGFESGVGYEINTSIDPNGSGFDASVDISLQSLQANEYWYDPDPLERTALKPAGKFDFLTIILHELGHPLGFVGDGSDWVFDFYSTGANNSRVFTGTEASAVYGGFVPLDPDSSHFKDTVFLSGLGLTPIMVPFISNALRGYVTPLDTAVLADLGIDVPAPSAGNDSVYGYDNVDDTVNLLAGHDFYDGVSGADNISGGSGNDSLYGGRGSDTLFGNQGADLLHGDAGDDTLDGGDDNDVLFGGDGADLIYGGIGADFLRGNAQNDTLWGDDGNDTLFGGNGADVIRGVNGDDLVVGGGGNDTIYGNVGNDDLRGREDNDRIFGGAGHDSATGADGNDLVIGGDGDDTLVGSDGADTLKGETGFDSLVGGPGNDVVFGAGDGDVMNGGGGSDSIFGQDGNDIVLGSTGADLLKGNAGADSLKGGDGGDEIFGGDGNDSLFGGRDDDTLNGGLNNDFLSGDSGNDLLKGGSGNDTFFFKANAVDNDTIEDFSTGAASDDIIELSGFGAGLDSFDEVIAASSQVGSDVVISFGGGETLTLLGVSIAELHLDDFIFSGP